MLGRLGFAKGMFRNYGKGPMAETEKTIHRKEHDEQAMIEEAVV